MGMILTDHSLQYGKPPGQQLVTVFGYPNKRVFDLVFGMTTLAIFLAASIRQLPAEINLLFWAVVVTLLPHGPPSVHDGLS